VFEFKKMHKKESGLKKAGENPPGISNSGCKGTGSRDPYFCTYAGFQEICEKRKMDSRHFGGCVTGPVTGETKVNRQKVKFEVHRPSHLVWDETEGGTD